MKYKTIIGVLTYRPHKQPTGNYGNILSHCLDSIYNNTILTDTQIIVANNSEDEETIKLITDICTKYPNLTLLNFKKNLGTSSAWNIITRLYDNDITVILNDDIIVYPYWLEVTKFILEKNSDVGTISYNVWYPYDHYDYNIPNDIKIWTNECIYPNGAAFAFRREIFDKIGGFDEQFFIGLEEADFGIRIIKARYFNYHIGTFNERGIENYRFIKHIGSATGYQQTGSYEKWIKKYNFPFPLDVETENNLRKVRNKNINLILPIIVSGNVVPQMN